MVFRTELIHSEIENTLDIKHTDTSTIGYTLPPGINETSDFNLKLKSLQSDDVKLNITIDNIKLKSNFTTNETKNSTKNSFFLCNTSIYSFMTSR